MTAVAASMGAWACALAYRQSVIAGADEAKSYGLVPGRCTPSSQQWVMPVCQTAGVSVIGIYALQIGCHHLIIDGVWDAGRAYLAYWECGWMHEL